MRPKSTFLGQIGDTQQQKIQPKQQSRTKQTCLLHMLVETLQIQRSFLNVPKCFNFEIIQFNYSWVNSPSLSLGSSS